MRIQLTNFVEDTLFPFGGVHQDEFIEQHLTEINRCTWDAAEDKGFTRFVTCPNLTDAVPSFVRIEDTGIGCPVITGYSERSGLQVLQRWVEALNVTPAKYLKLICYTAEQLKKERAANPDEGDQYLCMNEEVQEWGVVHIIALDDPKQEVPMHPETMLRNAAGMEHGGNGLPLDRAEYDSAVEFWSQHISVR